MSDQAYQPITTCKQTSCELNDHAATSSPELRNSAGNAGLMKTTSSPNSDMEHSMNIPDPFFTSSPAYQTLMPFWSICPPVFWQEGNMLIQINRCQTERLQHSDHSTSNGPAITAISRTDSGVGLCDPLQGDHRNLQICPHPETCELSPEMSQALQRLSIDHNCKYSEAERELVDKVRTFTS